MARKTLPLALCALGGIAICGAVALAAGNLAPDPDLRKRMRRLEEKVAAQGKGYLGMAETLRQQLQAQISRIDAAQTEDGKVLTTLSTQFQKTLGENAQLKQQLEDGGITLADIQQLGQIGDRMQESLHDFLPAAGAVTDTPSAPTTPTTPGVPTATVPVATAPDPVPTPPALSTAGPTETETFATTGSPGTDPTLPTGTTLGGATDDDSTVPSTPSQAALD